VDKVLDNASWSDRCVSPRSSRSVTQAMRAIAGIVNGIAVDLFPYYQKLGFSQLSLLHSASENRTLIVICLLRKNFLLFTARAQRCYCSTPVALIRFVPSRVCKKSLLCMFQLSVIGEGCRYELNL
jgi:hypothetical protein